MATADEILPPTSTPLERSLARALVDQLPVPLRQIVNPATAPAGWLPWLAAHESVDLWFQDWSESRKRLMVQMAPTLAWLKGTPEGVTKFLEFVDAKIERVIAYPQRFIFGQARIAVTPIGHQPFVARYLVRVETRTPPRAMVFGRSKLGRCFIKTPTREPFKRVHVAMRAAKAPETQYRTSFAYMRPLTLDDNPSLDGQFTLDDYVPTVYGARAPLRPAPADIVIESTPAEVAPTIAPPAAEIEITAYRPTII